MATYTYTKANPDLARLVREILAASITSSTLTTTPCEDNLAGSNNLTINYVGALSGGDQTTLTAVVAAHPVTASATPVTGDAVQVGATAGGDFTGTFPNPTVAASSVTNTKMANMAAETVKVNATTSAAAPTDLAVGTNTVLGRVTGDIVAAQLATGQIANNAVDNTKLAQIASATFKGRTTAATGNVEDLTAAQATALLNTLVGDTGTGGTKGLAPAPSSGDAAANKFLKADGNWTVPPSASSGMAVVSTPNVLDDSLTQPPAISGTVTATLASATVTGSGTSFTSLAIGMVVYFPASTVPTVPFVIGSIASDTSLTLSRTFSGTTISGTTMQATREGDAYIVGASPVNLWSGFAQGDLVVFDAPNITGNVIATNGRTLLQSGATTIAAGSNGASLPQSTINVVATGLQSSTASSIAPTTIAAASNGLVLTAATTVAAGSNAVLLSTTIAAGSNGAALPQATINVANATGFPTTGTITVVTGAGSQTVTYTGTTGTTFTGCTGGTGTMSTGGAVSLSAFTLNVAAATPNFVSTAGVINVATTNGTFPISYTGATPTTFTGCSAPAGAGALATGGAVVLVSFTLTVASIANFPTSGTLYVANNATPPAYQVLTYTGATGVTFTGVAVAGATGTLATGGVVATPAVFPTSGTIYVTTGAGVQTVTYTGLTATSFTGCSGGTGAMSTGGAVTGITKFTTELSPGMLIEIPALPGVFTVTSIPSDNALALVAPFSMTATTIGAGSNGAALPQATITVAATAGFPSNGKIYVTTSAGVQTVSYSGIGSATTFTGCSGGSGTMSTGGMVAHQDTSNITVKTSIARTWRRLVAGTGSAPASNLSVLVAAIQGTPAGSFASKAGQTATYSGGWSFSGSPSTGGKAFVIGSGDPLEGSELTYNGTVWKCQNATPKVVGKTYDYAVTVPLYDSQLGAPAAASALQALMGIYAIPPAGTYRVRASGSYLSGAIQTIVSIYAAGVNAPYTDCWNGSTAHDWSFANNCVVTVNGLQVVELRWRCVTTATATTMHQCVLMLERIG